MQHSLPLASVHHISLRCHDLQRTSAFYKSVLGFQVTHQHSKQLQLHDSLTTASFYLHTWLLRVEALVLTLLSIFAYCGLGGVQYTPRPDIKVRGYWVVHKSAGCQFHFLDKTPYPRASCLSLNQDHVCFSVKDIRKAAQLLADHGK